MRILFAGKQHFDPGGIPASTDQLAHRLSIAGHAVAVLAHRSFQSPPATGDRESVRTEAGRGYEAYSLDLLAPGAGLAILARRFRPDVIVVNAGGWWWHAWTRALVRAAPPDIPLVLYVRDSVAIELLDELGSRLDLVLVNAEHHARLAGRNGASATVIPSVVEPERYRVRPTGEAVVFINPVLSKGLATALEIAELRPDVPFHFRKCWRLPDRMGRFLSARIEDLDNVSLLPCADEPTEPYRQARLLLAPYRDFGRPRVVAEAQLSGIPVLARDDPPLREAVGPGGILVPPDATISAWLDGLAELWDDRDAFGRYARAACEHSQRAELDPDLTTSRFVDALSPLVTRR